MIKVIELFAGIGSQTQALKNQNIPHQVIAISEWAINSLITYAELHTDNIDYELTRPELLKELSKFIFSKDTKNPYDINKLSTKRLKLLYKSHVNSKNLGSISDIDGSLLSYCDLMTYSFPCTDLSPQGRQEGLYEGKQSSLLWQVQRILNEMKKLPKILLMENVSSILNKTNGPGFEKWKTFLSGKGYNNYVFKLKAYNYGIPQNRERCFMVSSLKPIRNLEHKIRKNEKLTDLKIKDILTDEYKKFDFLDKYLPDNIEFKKTRNDLIYFQLEGYTKFDAENFIYNMDSIAPTLTAIGANNRIKVFYNNQIRFLNSNEKWRLMGFKDEEFNKVKGIISEGELSKQAGNSIVVNILEEIFRAVFKD